MKIRIPELSLVVLVGASGSGKSTFARRHFKPTEVLSSDFCRGLVSDDDNDQAATPDAFELLHFIAAKRLSAGKLTVVDATNVQPESRKPLVALARQYHCIPVALVLNLPEKLCHERNASRADRTFGPYVIRQQTQQLRRSLRGLEREGFRHVKILSTPEDIEAAELVREPLYNNKRAELGPFDIIGDVHGCFDELLELLGVLGYEVPPPAGFPGAAVSIRHPQGRRLVFLGDLVDRGPNTPAVLRLVMGLVAEGLAYCVPGNHDIRLMRKLKGRDVQLTHGLAESVAQLECETIDFLEKLVPFLDGLVSHYVFDNARLVVAHAGMRQEMQGRGSGKVRDFALYGETTGETDEFGLPVRHNWATEYRGSAVVVYGHTPVPEPEWLNRTINIDTGCVFGGRLTALRYPEKELVSVPAKRTYFQPARPFLPEVIRAPALSAQQVHDELLDLDDVVGKRIISTRLQHTVTIREENAIAALEVMSRFAVNPKWLIYLPPTMAPTETSRVAGLLEHPAEAFAYYRHEGVPRVVCQEKHMGSRAVIILCRNADVARKRFGVVGEGSGICFTRTGRRFFEDRNTEEELLARLLAALESVGFWDEFSTDWCCLDCELMPWSAKAKELLRRQYAPVGAAARSALEQAVSALHQAELRGAGTEELSRDFQERLSLAEKFVASYRHYCWPVNSLDDLRLAPFHLLATEGKIHIDQNHAWHIAAIAKFCAADPKLLLTTANRAVDVTDPSSQDEAIAWWTSATEFGSEGIVVKPLDFVSRGRRGIAQPAVKCRGREYLRIIYGPEYTIPANLERLRSRGLAAKRSLALREFALGIEAMERFVRREPLRRVHECVFGVLALESEPVDPRL